ncbi:MAG: hypothetical protein ACRCT7_17810 [Shewanella sp.]
MNTLGVNKTDNFVIIFFVLSLLFSGSNVYALAYPLLKIFVFLGFAGIFFRFGFNIHNIKKEFITIPVIILISFWLVFSVLSTFLSVNEESIALTFRFASYFSVLVLISLLRSEVSYLFYKWYCTLMFYIALCSFLSYSLSVFNITQMTELVSSNSRVYFTTFFNIVMSDSKMTFGGLTFYRFQSIFEEPGTFAFLFIPIIYWYKLIDYRKFKLATSICMFLFTLSVGAFFSVLLLVALFYFIKRPFLFFPLAFVAFMFFIFSLNYFPEVSDFLSYKLGVGAYEGQHSSFGVRVLEISYVIETLVSSIFGVGLSPSNIYDSFGSSVSVGLFRLVLFSGAVGGVSILLVNSILFAYSLVMLSNKNNIDIFVGSTMISLLLMGVQRSTFMEGFLFISLFSFLLNIRFVRGYFER